LEKKPRSFMALDLFMDFALVRIALVKLDPVQIAALRFGEGKRGVGYFLEMGLGKTLLALEEFRGLVEKRVATRMIVVAPNSFKRGWADEIEKHGLNFDAHVFVSGAKTNDKWLSIAKYSKAPILIINYEAIRSSEVLLKLLAWARVK